MCRQPFYSSSLCATTVFGHYGTQRKLVFIFAIDGRNVALCGGRSVEAGWTTGMTYPKSD
jgi:hypothetical protein